MAFIAFLAQRSQRERDAAHGSCVQSLIERGRSKFSGRM